MPVTSVPRGTVVPAVADDVNARSASSAMTILAYMAPLRIRENGVENRLAVFYFRKMIRV
jgi:hypothetical protein